MINNKKRGRTAYIRKILKYYIMQSWIKEIFCRMFKIDKEKACKQVMRE